MERITDQNYTELQKTVNADRIIKVLNKTDLFSEKEIAALKKDGYIPCNTVTDEGLEPLKTHLLQLIKVSDEELHGGILTNSRQIAAVNKAIISLQKAAESLKH